MPRALSRTHFQTHFRAHFRTHLEEGFQAHVTAVRSHAHTQRSALGKCQWVLRWQDSLLQFTDHNTKKSERCSKLIFPQQRGDSSLCTWASVPYGTHISVFASSLTSTQSQSEPVSAGATEQDSDISQRMSSPRPLSVPELLLN